MNSNPLILDLFSGAGGAGSGYNNAGFTVIGVDILPQPHNPHTCYQDDALNVLDILLAGQEWNGYRLHDFTAIHASPVCKAYTQCNLSPREKHPMLIVPVRERLMRTGKPWVIENVMGAKSHMQANLMLCGTMFGLRTQRHRLFEIHGIDTPLAPASCNHLDAPLAVHGHSVWDSSKVGTPRKDGKRRPDSVPAREAYSAMGIDWMTQKELAQAIPPPYTCFIGGLLLSFINAERKVVA